MGAFRYREPGYGSWQNPDYAYDAHREKIDAEARGEPRDLPAPTPCSRCESRDCGTSCRFTMEPNGR